MMSKDHSGRLGNLDGLVRFGAQVWSMERGVRRAPETAPHSEWRHAPTAWRSSIIRPLVPVSVKVDLGCDVHRFLSCHRVLVGFDVSSVARSERELSTCTDALDACVVCIDPACVYVRESESWT